MEQITLSADTRAEQRAVCHLKSSTALVDNTSGNQTKKNPVKKAQNYVNNWEDYGWVSVTVWHTVDWRRKKMIKKSDGGGTDDLLGHHAFWSRYVQRLCGLHWYMLLRSKIYRSLATERQGASWAWQHTTHMSDEFFYNSSHEVNS